MEWNDHNPPHFHVKYAGDEATIEIATLSKSGGSLPKSIERLVFNWATLRQEELQRAWNLTKVGCPLIKFRLQSEFIKTQNFGIVGFSACSCSS